MVIIIMQADLPHDANRLHDQLIAAGVSPSIVRAFADRTEITVGDEEEEAAREAVSGYQPPEDVPAPTASNVIAALAQMNLEGVTTIAGLKAEITPIRDAAAAVIAAEMQQ